MDPEPPMPITESTFELAGDPPAVPRQRHHPRPRAGQNTFPTPARLPRGIVPAPAVLPPALEMHHGGVAHVGVVREPLQCDRPVEPCSVPLRSLIMLLHERVPGVSHLNPTSTPNHRLESTIRGAPLPPLQMNRPKPAHSAFPNSAPKSNGASQARLDFVRPTP